MDAADAGAPVERRIAREAARGDASVEDDEGLLGVAEREAAAVGGGGGAAALVGAEAERARGGEGGVLELVAVRRGGVADEIWHVATVDGQGLRVSYYVARKLLT